VGGGDAVDEELFAVEFGEVEEAADVVVLVVAGEEPLGFGGGQREGGERGGLAEFAGQGAVLGDQFLQGHHRSAARFSSHGPSVTPGGREEKA
jgi:hypothetical protein